MVVEEGRTARAFEGGGDKVELEALALGSTELAGGHVALGPLALGGGDKVAVEVLEAGGDKVELEALAFGSTEVALGPLALGGGDKVALEVLEAGGDKVEPEALALGLTEPPGGHVVPEPLALAGGDKVELEALALGLPEFGVELVALAFLGRGVNGLPSASACSCLRFRRSSGGRGMARASLTNNTLEAGKV